METVTSPEDLTGMGIHAGTFVSDRSVDERDVAIFDSLTVLLQYVDERTAYRFLNVLLGQFEAAGVDTYVRLAPEAVSDRTVSVFGPLFDAVVRPDG
nr:hypothetical protein [Halomarina sp. BCD28]